MSIRLLKYGFIDNHSENRWFNPAKELESSYDVVIIGSGLGGLCCGSILSLSGLKVLVCEKHSKPGGVAHSFSKNGYWAK